SNPDVDTVLLYQDAQKLARLDLDGVLLDFASVDLPQRREVILRRRRRRRRRASRRAAKYGEAEKKPRQAAIEAPNGAAGTRAHAVIGLDGFAALAPYFSSPCRSLQRFHGQTHIYFNGLASPIQRRVAERRVRGTSPRGGNAACFALS